MSTKTTFKRLALVTAVALGLGGLSAVSATVASAAATYTVGTPSATPAVTGSVFTISAPVTFSVAATSDTATIAIATSTKPATSNVTLSDPGQTAVTTAAGSGITLTPVLPSPYTTNTITATAHAIVATDTARTVNAKFGVSVDKAGTYVFAIIDDIDGTGTLTTGDGVQYLTVIVADSAASSVALSTDFSASYASYVSDSAAGANGAWVKVAVKDAAGAATVPNSSQMVLVNIPSTATLRKKAKSGASTAVGPISNGSYGLVAGDFNTSGVAYINVTASAGTSTITANLVGGTANAASLALTYVAVTGNATTMGALKALDGSTVGAGAAVGNGGNLDVTGAAAGTVNKAATSFGVVIAGATAVVMGARVANGSVGSTLFGGGSLAEDVVLDASAQTAASTSTASTDGTTGLYPVTLTISGSLAAQANGTYANVKVSPYTTYTNATAAQDFIITGATTTGTKLTMVAPLAANISVSPAATTAVTVKCVDQFGAAKASVTLTPAITGRNAALVTLPTLVTDASGKASFSYTDASTSTTSLTDAIAVTGCTTSATLLTVNYGSSTVSTLTVTGGNTTKSVTAPVVAPIAMTAGDGVETAATGIAATVKDVNGVGIVGVPVTFSVAGTGVAFTSTSATVYSTTGGVATGYLYAWVAGTYTYTVTAGGLTTTGTATFADSTPANARTISVVAVGNVVTATVKDRFGNPVSASTVSIKTTGGANVGGAFQTSGTTLTDGTISWVVSGSGTATVYSNLNPSAVAGTNPSDQSCALAGNLTCASGATAAVAFTASTVGTTTTAETGVGASIAPAGVNSASVTVSGNDQAGIDAAQAAQDAANEATDAANAATDAANNAMDSADAAQQAAMDAGDKADAALAAVTDLATKVSEIATQISSLSAVVAKIAAAVAKISAKVKA